MKIKLDAFTQGYISCALWCGVMSYDENEELNNADNDFSDDDLTDEARETIEKECRDFVANNISDLLGCGLDSEQCGHDFYLTRNRHGAGFWDRKSRGKYADQCLDRLTEASHAYGDQTLIADDNGNVSIL